MLLRITAGGGIMDLFKIEELKTIDCEEKHAGDEKAFRRKKSGLAEVRNYSVENMIVTANPLIWWSLFYFQYNYYIRVTYIISISVRN